MAKPFYTTNEGLEKLKNELQELKTKKRPEVIKRIENAKELGDLSENAEYADARDEQAFMEGRIQDLEEMINNAAIIEKQDKQASVGLGATITVKSNGEEKKFTIVGSNEADPLHGIISHESPLGKAFLGRRLDDEVEVTVPKGKIRYKITEIQ